MKILKCILLLLLLSSCSSSKNKAWNCIQIDEGSLAFCEMIELIGKTKVDTNNIKAVKIYSYRFKKNGNVKDSTLIDYQNINYFSTFKDHTIYEIKYDSLGRDFERYATRIETGETHLNYRKAYDAKSNLILWTVYNRDGHVNFDIRYEYNSDNKLIKETKYYGYFLYDEPELKYIAYYEYLSDNIVKTINCNENLEKEKCNSIRFTKSDKNGNIIESNSGFLDNGNFQSSEKMISSYKINKKISEKYYASDTLRFVRSYKYNELNLPISTTIEYPIIKYPTQLTKYFYQKNKKTMHKNDYK